MSNIALYRKYRPRNFSNVFGQLSIIKTLQSSIKNNSINHAYIFSGPRGSGKTSIAKIFSKAVNCEHLDDKFDLCNNCQSCLESIKENPMDIIEIDAASNNGINEIRNIIDSVSYIPNSMKHKVYIIDEAHMLTNSSWNALLKTLEEPPKYVIFIFATTEFNKIPATIISRCQRYDFNRLSDLLLHKMLLNISEKENIKIDLLSLNSIVQLADGAARDAINILDQLSSYTNKNIVISDVEEIFGLVNINNKINLINFIIEHDIENIILFINNQYQKGVNLSLLLSDLIKILFDKIIFIQTNNILHTKILNESNILTIKNIELNKLLLLINHFNLNTNRLSKSVDKIFDIQLILLQAINIINNGNVTLKKDNKIINNVNNTMDVIEENIEKEKINITEHQFFSTNTIMSNIPLNNIDNSVENKIDKELINTQKLEINPISEKEKINNILEPKIINIIESDKSTNLETKETIDLFNTNELEINKNEIIKVSSAFNNYEKIKEQFFKIASNHNKELKILLNNQFIISKENKIMESPIINKLLLAKNILISSNNGVVFLFDNKIQSNNFNNISKQESIRSWFKENFSSEKILIGVDKETAKEFTEAFKLNIKIKLEDIELENKNTKAVLLDILNE